MVAVDRLDELAAHPVDRHAGRDPHLEAAAGVDDAVAVDAARAPPSTTQCPARGQWAASTLARRPRLAVDRARSRPAGERARRPGRPASPDGRRPLRQLEQHLAELPGRGEVVEGGGSLGDGEDPVDHGPGAARSEVRHDGVRKGLDRGGLLLDRPRAEHGAHDAGAAAHERAQRQLGVGARHRSPRR